MITLVRNYHRDELKIPVYLEGVELEYLIVIHETTPKIVQYGVIKDTDAVIKPDNLDILTSSKFGIYARKLNKLDDAFVYVFGDFNIASRQYIAKFYHQPNSKIENIRVILTLGGFPYIGGCQRNGCARYGKIDFPIILDKFLFVTDSVGKVECIAVTDSGENETDIANCIDIFIKNGYKCTVAYCCEYCAAPYQEDCLSFNHSQHNVCPSCDD